MTIIKRRNFIKAMGIAPLASSLIGHKVAAAEISTSTPEKTFGFSNNKVPMNAANLCPMPSAITNSIDTYSSSLDFDMSGKNRAHIMAIKEQAREGIAKQLNLSVDDIAIVRNTSEANNIVAQGLSLKARDEILLWDQNHPSNDISWSVRAKRSSCIIKHITIPTDTKSIDEVVDIFLEKITPKTKVVSFTHISNITGFRLPAREICQAIKNKFKQIHIHIDGAQTWGLMNVDLDEMGCDSFSGSAHKWYMGPREMGLLVVREESLDQIWPSIVSIGWGNKAETSAIGARKFEALGQRDDASLAALFETVNFHNEITTAGIESKATKIANYLRESLKDINVNFVSSHNPLFTSNVIILKAPREGRQQLLQNILNDGGIILAGTGGLRMSPHVYNTTDHIDRVTEAINKSRNLLG
ncbi:MAG: hypothetical protein CMP00_05210 [Woeseiaceae bacterium]|nr:hypothetical protein [Woeseiaceae bacterium]